jgi:hypothetical protein
MCQSACAAVRFIKAKLHKWNKAEKVRKNKSFGVEKRTV